MKEKEFIGYIPKKEQEYLMRLSESDSPYISDLSEDGKLKSEGEYTKHTFFVSYLCNLQHLLGIHDKAGDTMFFSEFIMALNAVFAYAHNSYATLYDLAVPISERAGFFCASRSIVLGIEIQKDLLSFVILK